MQIDLNILLQNVLPTFLRRARLVNLLRALLSGVVQPFNWFIEQLPGYQYKALANGSVLSLEHAIKREFDIDVVITELDGKPVDFLVSVFGIVDLEKLKSFIDQNKLAGRSYVFESGEVTYSCQFINHACEVTITDNLLTVQDEDGAAPDTTLIYVTAASPAASALSIQIRVVKGSVTEYYTLSMASGSATSSSVTVEYNSIGLTITIMSVTPVSDYTYKYTY